MADAEKACKLSAIRQLVVSKRERKGIGIRGLQVAVVKFQPAISQPHHLAIKCKQLIQRITLRDGGKVKGRENAWFT